VRRRRIQVCGTSIDAVSLDELLGRLNDMVDSDRSHYVCFCEMHLCVRAALEREVRRVLDGASLVLPDGVSMTAGARLVAARLPERLPGPSVMLEFCRRGVARRLRHFFYGGAPGVAERLGVRLKAMIPGLEIAGTCGPPFRPLTTEEEGEVRGRIERARTQVLWVGLGAPKQELWMAEQVGRIRVPLMLGVGAAFDFHSGDRRWAPRWVRKAGREWAYRMLTGGRRMLVRYPTYGILFIGLLLEQLLDGRRGVRDKV